MYSGVLKIVRFNWPWYALAIAATFSVIFCIYLGILSGPWMAIVVAGLIVSNIWLVASLVVSHYIYDLSGIHHGAWLDGINASHVGHVGIFHAGHDEASKAVALRLPSATVEIFDFYDAGRNGTGSLERARAAAPRRDLAINVKSGFCRARNSRRQPAGNSVSRIIPGPGAGRPPYRRRALARCVELSGVWPGSISFPVPPNLVPLLCRRWHSDIG